MRRTFSIIQLVIVLLGLGFVALPLVAAEIGNAAVDSTTAYGELRIPGADIRDSVSAEELAQRYKNARMAFLFGNYKMAFAAWEPLAVKGHAKSQATLAWMYHTGQGAKKDLRQAFYWYQRAANQSHEIAHNNLGVFYEQGLGVSQDYKKAAEHYRESAGQGYRFAQYNLGVLYEKGLGVEKDKKLAIYWLQLAAWQEVPLAQAQLQAMGLSVDIPQHEKVNEASKKATLTPKWHRQPDSDPLIPKSDVHGPETPPAANNAGVPNKKAAMPEPSKPTASKSSLPAKSNSSKP